MVNPLKCLLTAPIHPTVFGEELSYYETLRVILDTLNNVIAELQGIEERCNAYTDSEIAKVRADFNATIASLREIVNSINTQVQANTLTINAHETKIANNTKAINKNYEDIKSLQGNIQTINTNINNLRDTLTAEDARLAQLIDDNFTYVKGEINRIDTALETQKNMLLTQIQMAKNECKGYTDSEVSTLRKYVDDIILTSVKVISPVTGLLGSVQTALDDIAGLWREAFTAEEWDATTYTCSNRDSRQYTAYEIDYMSKTLYGG